MIHLSECVLNLFLRFKQGLHSISCSSQPIMFHCYWKISKRFLMDFDLSSISDCELRNLTKSFHRQDASIVCHLKFNGVMKLSYCNEQWLLKRLERNFLNHRANFLLTVNISRVKTHQRLGSAELKTFNELLTLQYYETLGALPKMVKQITHLRKCVAKFVTEFHTNPLFLCMRSLESCT